jgi:hypothetical protein
VLAEWTAQGSGDEPLYQAPLHEHAEDEAWYVLEGTLAIRVGDDVHLISAGGAVIVPGGTAHTFWNPRPDPARYLLVVGARTFALIQASMKPMTLALLTCGSHTSPTAPHSSAEPLIIPARKPRSSSALLGFPERPDSQATLLKNWRMSAANRSGTSMAAKWPPWGSSAQCVTL